MQSDDAVCPICGSLDECEHDIDTGHSSHRLSNLKTASEAHRMLEMVTLEPLDLSQSSHPLEIFNTYGGWHLDNATLLKRYGFAVQANPHDRITWAQTTDVVRAAGIISSPEFVQEWPATLAHLGRNPKVISMPNSTLVVAGSQPFDFSINADAALSQPLWLLCALLARPRATTSELQSLATRLIEFEHGQGDALHDHHDDLDVWLGESACLVCQVVASRRADMHRSEMSTSDLIDLCDVRELFRCESRYSNEAAGNSRSCSTSGYESSYQ